MKYPSKIFFILILFSLMVAACGQITVGVESTDLPVVEGKPEATQTPGEGAKDYPHRPQRSNPPRRQPAPRMVHSTGLCSKTPRLVSASPFRASGGWSSHRQR